MPPLVKRPQPQQQPKTPPTPKGWTIQMTEVDGKRVRARVRGLLSVSYKEAVAGQHVGKVGYCCWLHGQFNLQVVYVDSEADAMRVGDYLLDHYDLTKYADIQALYAEHGKGPMHAWIRAVASTRKWVDFNAAPPIKDA